MKPTPKNIHSIAALKTAVETKDSATVREILEANGGKKGLMGQDGGAPMLMATAIRNEDIEVMRALRDVGGISIDFQKQLGAVVRANKMELLEACIEAGLDKLSSPELQKSPWGCQFASNFDSIEVFKKAMAKSEDPLLFLNQCDSDWDSPITNAMEFGGVDLVQGLIELGAIPNYKTARKSLRPEEDNLAGKGKRTKLEVLLDAGYDPNTPMRGGYSLLHTAAQDGRLHLCKILVQRGAHVNARSSNGSTPLLWAANQPECGALLLKHGANVHAVNDKGQNVLFLSVENPGKFLLWQDILDRDSPLYWAKDHNGSTLLHMATFWAQEKRMPAWLIDGLCDRFLNEPDAMGRTPLHQIAGSGDASALDLLLRKGADMEARDHEGFTPLMFAAKSGNTHSCTTLIMAGAEPNAQEMGGRTALDLAMEKDRSEAYPVLIAAGGRTAESDFRFIPESSDTKYLIKDCLLVAAMKTDNIDYFRHHLSKNPNPTSEDIAAAKKHLKKSGKKPEMDAMLNSHIAQMSIDSVLGMTAHKGP